MALGMGGSESNVVIGIQRFGGTAVWRGSTGTDSLGTLALREVLAEGVNVCCGGLRRVHRPDPEGTPDGATQKVSYYRADSADSG